MKILALMKYGDRAASTRQRLRQYCERLDAHDISVEFEPLLDNTYVENLALGRKVDRLRLLSAYWSRIQLLLTRHHFDLIWLHCEAFPYLPGFMERLVFYAGKPVVYDFDDAIFHQYDNHRNIFVRAMLGGKLKPLLRRVSASSCGNAYLKAYAERFCDNSEILPTVVDTNLYRPAPECTRGGPVTIGWIGSPSTWLQLKPIVPLLLRLREKFDLHIRVVGAGCVEEHFPEVDFIDWSEENEVFELQKMDIGIMPLPDEPWARGKCGYKLIQYMACGLPVVASPVGVNAEIVSHGENGFLASTEEEWHESLTRLAADPDLRRAMGVAGRARIESEFSLKVQAPRMVELLKSVAG